MVDHLLIRCPKLGGEVTFAYCRQEGGGFPCDRVLTCWQARFPVADFLKTVLHESDWRHLVCRQPKDRVTRLLESIEEAKKRLQSGQDNG